MEREHKKPVYNPLTRHDAQHGPVQLVLAADAPTQRDYKQGAFLTLFAQKAACTLA